jgi:hypothetical protein
MSEDKPKILRVRDKNEKHGTKKKYMFDIPFRVCLIAKSGVGKTNLIVNMFCQDNKNFYKKDFEGDNMYVFSPSIKTDHKLKILIEQMDIPPSNLFMSLDMDMLEAVYELIKEDYEEAIREKEKPKNTLIIIDDCMDSLKSGGKNGILDKMASNARHQNCSFIITSQYYTKIPPCVRANCNGMVIFETSDKILETICEEHSYCSHKDFKKKFRELTNHSKHSFLMINYTNKKKDRYLNDKFDIIDF